MAKKTVTRKDLIERWSAIEQEDDDDSGGLSSVHPIKRRRLRQLKEQWFLDTFNFLINIPAETHVWCGYWDLMGPLLETFYNYFKEESRDSPLRIIWKRISGEMRHCSLCVHQHHQAQEMYGTEYEQSCISPLLDVLHTLDEERISGHLKDLNDRIARGVYDPTNDYGEVVSVMFEVMMFPYLLDDQYLATEFEKFIDAIDNTHELTLDGHQQYPGVYALFFSQSRRVRSIGIRLAGHMGKLRISTDLDPLQNLIRKCISILETESMKTAIETSRPRVQLDRITIWLGMKALVGFLEPPAFEEGILDRYPIFLSIVLNHISDDSVEFSHAVNCLRLLFEKLGYKLWLRATLSPGVMRNTLLGQCFHTRNEKIHKEIFDLFQPLLQSLEALQDGEHEKQRRHFLYFLLHQVPVSSNFSTLMRQKACQIALLIIIRGYRMDPPCPPSECAHMWGPSLVSSLKDSSLHSSLRQPALDLIQTIIVSDASALMSVILNGQLHPSDKPIRRTSFVDGEDEEDILFDPNTEEKDVSCWRDFIQQHKIISQVDGNWMCVPMLWFDVLVEIDPVVLPFTFSKAVFWALSQFTLIEPDNSAEMAFSVRNWLSNCASEISYLLGWKVPSGSDDGGDGTESRNSIRTSTMCLPLVRTFKRFTVHYIVKMQQQEELMKQWTWEPMMSNSLILFLVDPNDTTRQLGRLTLEKVSNVRGLTCGLQFLCSLPSSLLAVFLGLRHALELVHLDSVLLNFRTLHHLFFIMYKLLKEGNSSASTVSHNSSVVSDVSKFSSQGGFLKQPIFDSSPSDGNGSLSIISSASWKKFCCLLSQVAWLSIVKCLDGGKPFTNYTVSQMTCIRLLEIMPIVFERLPRNSVIMMDTLDNIKWLHDLADWGKSSLAVVIRYWKQTMASLLGLIKASCSDKSASAICDIEKLILYEKVSVDEVSKQVARLSVSLIDDGSAPRKIGFQSKHTPSEETFNKRSTEDSGNSLLDKAEVIILDSEPVFSRKEDSVILLSDDERDPEVSVSTEFSQIRSSQITHADNTSNANAVRRETYTDLNGKGFIANEALMVSPEVSHSLDSSHSTDFVSDEKITSDKMGAKAKPDSKREEKQAGDAITNSFVLHKNTDLKKVPDETVNSKKIDSFASQAYSSSKAFPDTTATGKVRLSVPKPLKTTGEVIKDKPLKPTAEIIKDKPLKATNEVLKEIVKETDDDDAWQFSFFKQPKNQPGLVTRPIAAGPKRQVIQLSMPVDKRPGSLRMEDGIKRFKPPRLDEWYRPVLELDFFVTVGLESQTDKECQNVSKLKEVPVCFQSPDEYVDIFRPLVLEEFKAQLHNSYQEISSTEEMSCGSLSVLSVERIDDFHVVRFVHDEAKFTGSKSLLENDLVLLTRQPLQNSACEVHAIGKVERREKDNKRRLNISAVKLYLQGCSRLNRVRKLLTERSKWCISRIMSITPQLREFQALSSITEIPLLPVILNPINHPCGQHESRTSNLRKLSEPLQQILKSSYNGSQLQAISHSISASDLKKNFELTLIQGPPGTGKTRTIVAIVSGLLVFSQMKDAKISRNDGLTFNSSSISKGKISETAAIARAWQDAALAKQLNVDAERNNKSSGSYSRGRVLICAQSNAAVDELVARLSSEGLYGSNGLMYKPYLVRIGNSKTVHPNSLAFFIDTLVENRLYEEKSNANDEEKSGNGTDLIVIRNNLEKLADQIRYYEAKRANLQEGDSDSTNLGEGHCEDGKVLSDSELNVKLRQLYAKKKAMYTDLANVQARERKAGEELRALRHKLRMTILKEAEIVVTTLSGCGGDLYGVCSESTSAHKFMQSSENALFDAVVIDEAAQALEPATLIPLQLLKSRGTKCIMVGDPKQLPATVLSSVASKYSFQCSMFERLQRAGHPVIMLTQQYRMHPEICRFPSSHFYDGKLLDGDQMSSKAASFHETWSLGPYVFFDIADGQELRGKNAAALSMYNECEADAAVEVLRFFKKRYPSEFFGGRIGIITPYKSQLSLLRSRFSSAFGSSITSEMEFNTVDGFQGREVDILLLSTVRASGPCSEKSRVNSSILGFVADVRRMNVALTRARLSLWIFGNARTLQTNPSWAALVDDAKRRDLIVSGRKPYGPTLRLCLENGSSSGKPANSSSQLERVDRVKKYSKHERKRVYEDVKDAGRHEKENVSNRSFSLEKELEPVEVPIRNNKGRKVSKSTINENDEKNADKSSANAVKADIREAKKNDNVIHSGDTGKMKFRNREHPKPPIDERGMKFTKRDNRKEEVKLGASSSGRSDEKLDSKRVENVSDSIMKRKEQREAVDALLSSALISSKKPNSLTSSSSRRVPPTKSISIHPVRPKKPRKD